MYVTNSALQVRVILNTKIARFKTPSILALNLTPVVSVSGHASENGPL